MPPRERLQIHNFGPIRQADIDVRDITVFLGPQATGKSLCAQTLYFMRGMEELLVPGSWGFIRESGKKSISLAERVAGHLASWLGIRGISYKETSISWSPVEADGSFEDRLELSYQPAGAETARINRSLEGRVGMFLATLGIAMTRERSLPENQVYIPAGRMLYSFVPPSLGMFLQSPQLHRSDEWPGYISVFYFRLGEALRLLYERTKEDGFEKREPIEDWIQKIMKGRLFFTDPDQVMFSVLDRFSEEDGYGRSFKLNAAQLASGQMEQWPFWTLIRASLLKPDRQTRIFFDEPEAHLHPSAQITLVESIAHLTRKNLRFVLTTHSPYVVYALNNFLLAQQVLDAGGTLSASSAADTALRREQVSAYRFTDSGQVESILDEETGLIKTDELDDPAGALNAAFSDMQDALFERKK
ncbi:MAG: AAA family ATPase [Polyangia bacterium]